MTSGARVLLVEDDTRVSEAIAASLARGGYQVTTVHTGHDGLRAARARRPDVVLLDLGLPDLDGIEVLRRLRAVSDVPVIVVSARGEKRDVNLALATGANDYLVKPFGLDDLVLRIEQTQRERIAAEQRADQVYDDGILRLDAARKEVHVAGEPVTLSATEFALLETLVWHAGTAQPLDTLVEKAWGNGTNNGNAASRMKFTMYRLRKKLETTPLGSGAIVAARNLGYLYRPPNPARVDDRVARDLHDLVIQRLFTVGMGLRQLTDDVEPQVAERLRSFGGILDEAIQEIRNTIAPASTAAAAGLTSRVFACARDAEATLGFEPKVTITGSIDEAVPAEIGAELVAILREALSNVARHAKATTTAARIELRPLDSTPHLVLTVTDDGIGLPARHVPGSGLTNMAARAERWQGEFTAQKGKLGGTELKWLVPLPVDSTPTA